MLTICCSGLQANGPRRLAVWLVILNKEKSKRGTLKKEGHSELNNLTELANLGSAANS